LIGRSNPLDASPHTSSSNLRLRGRGELLERDLARAQLSHLFFAELLGAACDSPHSALDEYLADCRVGPARNALLGQVVAAEIVWRGQERDALKVKRILHEFAGEKIARHKLPTLVRLVDGIAPTRNMKRSRTRIL